ncbi:NAD(P)/FAD-dependent oxidoreductase [Mesorhizobium sp. AR10]|uniref:NAD(P)/FAD-dependent oxidoreductase n=1 Tax=Mesorhizobium sp. AR10 TaxID=2865839 RepID=UPI00215E00EF|nr:NAD(P)/FAD-dependent oxidoreductase [Mesorhizobium sp. AR10]
MHDAIVIGAGPAGSSTAIALAQHGWSVAMVEKVVFPRRKVCGEFMSGTSLALLDRLGVGEIWRAEAGPEVRRVGFFSGDVSAQARMPIARTGLGRALGRDRLDYILLQAAERAGVEILQPCKAVAIHQRDDLQFVTVEAGQQQKVLSAPVIIAAHGSWEAGKLPSQLERTNRPSDLFGFKAHFTGAALPPDLMPLLVFPGGYGGMVTADRGRVSISCCIRRDVLSGLRERFGNIAAADALWRHVLASCQGVGTVLAGAELDGPWLAAGPIHPGIRAGYDQGIFRVGNIAGESHPVIAEGISMALQSGWLLARELIASGKGREGHDAAGRRYERAWRRQFSARLRAAALIARIALGPGGGAAMRVVINIFPAALTLGARLSGKTQRVPGF